MLNIEPFRQSKQSARITLPQYPTDWKPVKELPNLSGVKSLALDTETYDPELKTAGPGWGRGVGHIIGVSLATHDAAWYFPIRHKIQPELNMNPDMVLRWLNDVLSTDIPKIGANLYYDLGWLAQEGVTVKGKAYDIQIAEKLIDETQFIYSLESIAKKYIGEGKVSDEVYEWCAKAYGGKPNGDQRANLHRAPVSLVGPYAEADARLPFDILKKQWKYLEALNLEKIFNIETRLLPLLVDMRLRGVNVSVENAEIAKQELKIEILNHQQEINEMAGFKVNVNSALDLEKLFKKAGVEINYTKKGNPSFQKEWLESEPHPAAHLVRSIRQHTKTISTFLESAIINKEVNGKVYGQFNQLGAITGRFSSSNPNLQNIPSRDKRLGPLMRSIFIPEENKQWIKLDYSSVEFRIFAHFIKDPVLLEAYKTNSKTDFHQVVQDMVGGGLPRVAYKTISFSQMFGGGIRTITKQMFLNFSLEEAKELIHKFGAEVLSNPHEQLARLIMNVYNERFPAVKDALEKASDLAEYTGEMRTLLNRRVTYNKWEPIRGNGVALPQAGAIKKYGKSNIRRAKTYKALNVYTQGGSADVMKKAMVLAYEAGLFNNDKLGPPHLTVHDELDLSVTQDNQKDLKELKEIMENSIKLDVPLIVDAEVGPNWGSVKDFDLETWSLIK